MATSKPAISIITPVWNGLPYIRECVESVFSQEFKEWEFVISDNGSTDGTRDYLDTLTDSRVRIFKQEQNLGIQGNLNFLISKANAPIAYILCADDYFYPGGLGRALTEWSTVAPETAFIAFNWKDAIKHSALAKYSHEVIPKKIDPITSRFVFFLFGNVSGNLSNVSVKVDTLKTSGGFNKNLRQTLDFELWSRIARDHPMVLSDTATAFVRVHENAATAYMNTKGQRFAEDLVIYEKLIEELLPYVDRRKLLTYVNIEIASFHLRDAIKAALHGRFARMANFMETKSSISWPKWKQLILCLPFALSERGRHKLMMKMSKDIMKHNR